MVGFYLAVRGSTMVTEDNAEGYNNWVLNIVKGYIAVSWTAVSALVCMIIAEVT